jgi:hypothetical protein
MDVVPVLMEVEQRLGVTVPDGRAWPNTVGELYLAVLGQARRRALGTCPTGRAFYHLRRTLTAEFAADRQRVRPATRLCDLFPAASRGATWPRLVAALGLPDLPGLPRRRVPSGRALRIALAAVTAAWWVVYPFLVLVTGDAFSLAYAIVIWSLLALFVGEMFGLFWLAGVVDYLERVRVPQVRHLVIRLAIQQADQAGGGEPTARAVWADLATLIAAQAGIPVQEIHPEQRLADLPDY